MEKTKGKVVSMTKSLLPSPHITNEKSETKKLNIGIKVVVLKRVKAGVASLGQ